MFDGLVHQVETKRRILLTYKDSWYAKIDMHHMWLDVLNKIDSIIYSPEKAPKLSITIGLTFINQYMFDRSRHRA